MTRNIILNVKKFVDGDGLIAEDYQTKREFEIRLYGIDAPEMNYCNKIKMDERELHLPAAFLIKLGYMSFEFLKSNISIGDKCTLVQENNNLQDNR
jgi:micrococcal nuclease